MFTPNAARKALAFLSLLCLVLPSKVFAQPEKFGKIDAASFQLTAANDSLAPAVVLFDVGKSYFQYNSIDGFQLIFERHRRVKILKKEGYDYANIEISYYTPQGESENISDLKGFTYLLKNGAVEKIKLEKTGIFDEKSSDNWHTRKVTMPNVEEGCIIELTYRLNSPHAIRLKSWSFQEMIPVIWSEYTVEIPEYFYFQKYQQGYIPISDYQKNNTESAIPPANEVRYRVTSEKWVMQNVPAFRPESYVSAHTNYISKIEFQLATLQFPGRPIQNILNSWEQINQQLLEMSTFGGQIKSATAKKLAEQIKAQYKTPQEQVIAATALISRTMKWDGGESIFGSKGSVDKAYEAKTGNCADINLLLVGVLQEMGIPAEPVILSTTDNGRLNPAFPLINKFNYVIALTMLDNKPILLDATVSNLPFGMLPLRCLNGQGRRVSPTNPDWINLTGGTFTQQTQVAASFSPEFGLTGNIKHNMRDYAAQYSRTQIKKAENPESYFSEKVINHTVSEVKLEGMDNPQDHLNVSFHFEGEAAGEAPDRLYIEPVFEKSFDENPFKQEKREYPVDFPCPQREMYTFNLIVPDGYEVEEMPQPKNIALPGNSAKFMFQAALVGKNIQLTSSLQINKQMFLPDEYTLLKEFVNQVIEKQNEQIVLKKISSGGN